MSQGQQIDAIIAEEGLTNAPVQPDPEPTPTPDGEIAPVTPTDDKPADTQQPTPLTTIQPEDKPAEDKKDGEVTPVEPEAPKLPEAPAPKVSEQVEQSRSFIDNLNLTEDKIFTAEGTVVPFREVVPPGQFLVAQLEPVRVVDKDGKSHEFLLLSDVEKTFRSEERRVGKEC